MRTTTLLLTVVLCVACDGGDEEPSGSAESSTGGSSGVEEETDADTDARSCAQVPTITYDTFGRGFLATYCNGCHGGEVDNRQGAPADVVFDTHEQATDWADRIAARVFPAEGSAPMPPAGGVVSADEERAQIWLDCYP